METRLILPLALTFAFLAVGCSTASVRVMPGTDGTNRVVAKDHQQEGAEEAAVKGANEYCEKRGKEARFVQNDSRYNGKMDETARNTIRKASNVAMVLGGFGTPVSQAGVAGSMMTSDRDYESQVVFKCQ